MSDPHRVADHLHHIPDAIDRATLHASKAVTFAVFEREALLQDGIIRNIGVTGEAAVKIAQMAPEFIAAHPQIPWREMQTMRHKLVHDYFDVDLPVVCDTVLHGLPPLALNVREMLSTVGSEPLPPGTRTDAESIEDVACSLDLLVEPLSAAS